MQRRAGQRILMEFNQINKNPEEGFAVTAEEPSKQWTVTMAGPEVNQNFFNKNLGISI